MRHHKLQVRVKVCHAGENRSRHDSNSARPPTTADIHRQVASLTPSSNDRSAFTQANGRRAKPPLPCESRVLPYHGCAFREGAKATAPFIKRCRCSFNSSTRAKTKWQPFGYKQARSSFTIDRFCLGVQYVVLTSSESKNTNQHMCNCRRACVTIRGLSRRRLVREEESLQFPRNHSFDHAKHRFLGPPFKDHNNKLVPRRESIGFANVPDLNAPNEKAGQGRLHRSTDPGGFLQMPCS